MLAVLYTNVQTEKSFIAAQLLKPFFFFFFFILTFFSPFLFKNMPVKIEVVLALIANTSQNIQKFSEYTYMHQFYMEVSSLVFFHVKSVTCC